MYCSSVPRPDARFRQIQQQLRFGVPSVIYTTGAAVEMQLLRPRATDPSIFVARALEPNMPDHVEATFAVEPTHGLYCRRRWKLVMDRQDNVRWRRSRRTQPGVQTSTEPWFENPRNAADQQRGDIKVVHKDGMTWVLDVGVVVCPGVQRFVNVGADTVILYTLDRTRVL